MEIEKTRGYGIAASDAEGSWDSAFKSKIKKLQWNNNEANHIFAEKFKCWFVFIKKSRELQN